MKQGQKVIVLHGASDWMRKHNYWLEDYGESIDGMEGVISGDYTDLPGNDCHYGVELGFHDIVGINPQWLIPVTR